MIKPIQIAEHVFDQHRTQPKQLLFISAVIYQFVGPLHPWVKATSQYSECYVKSFDQVLYILTTMGLHYERRLDVQATDATMLCSYKETCAGKEIIQALKINHHGDKLKLVKWVQ